MYRLLLIFILISPQNKLIKSKSEAFLLNLQNNESLSSLMAENWTFIYHEDNRCTGSTDGKLIKLKPEIIDSKFLIELYNDGIGWACDTLKPHKFNVELNIYKLTKDWDRFEVFLNDDYKNQSFLYGKGESDYIILHFNSENKINILEYRSEDPG